MSTATPNRCSGAQYSSVEWTKTRMTVQSTVILAPIHASRLECVKSTFVGVRCATSSLQILETSDSSCNPEADEAIRELKELQTISLPCISFKILTYLHLCQTNYALVSNPLLPREQAGFQRGG